MLKPIQEDRGKERFRGIAPLAAANSIVDRAV